MRRHRNFLLFIGLAVAVATPALGQTVTSGVGLASGVTKVATSIPDFSRIWMHPAFPGSSRPHLVPAR
jgi:hypothetical protein